MTIKPNPQSLLSGSLPATWLDSRNLGRSGGTGVTTYALGVRSCLKQMGVPTALLHDGDPADDTVPPSHGPVSRIRLFLKALLPFRFIRTGRSRSSGSFYPFVLDLYRSAHIHFKLCKRIIWLKSAIPPGIMYWTYPLPVLIREAINIVTIHDLIPLTHPHLTGIDSSRLRCLLSQLVVQADLIVTVSETVRTQILEMLPVAPDKVINLYQVAGVTQQEQQKMATAPRVAPAGCFICIGRVEKRKNIERVIEAHARSGSGRPLVIVGPDGDDTVDLQPRRAGQQIIRVPWCSRASLLRALADAHALVFPSLAEGFGLPIIEAMALGIPTLTSRGGATEEIAANAAILVDPYDMDDITQALVNLDTMTPDMPEWQNLRMAGFKRAETFSAEAQILRLRGLYKELERRFPDRIPFSGR